MSPPLNSEEYATEIREYKRTQKQVKSGFYDLQ